MDNLLALKYVGDDILRQKARRVDCVDDQIRSFFSKMVKTMHHANGIGLAAPQVGLSKQLIVVDLGEGPICVANPKIIDASGERWGLEGCLSIPGIFGEVKRFKKIAVRGLDPNNKKITIEADEMLAVVFQHEIDHLRGKLFTDVAKDLYDGSLVEEDETE